MVLVVATMAAAGLLVAANPSPVAPETPKGLRGTAAREPTVFQQNRPLTIVREWAAGTAVVLAFPLPPPGDAQAALAARIADRALLAALRDATEAHAADIRLERDESGRYFVATTATSREVDKLLASMQRTAASRLPAPLVSAAAEAVAHDLAFRGTSPSTRFDAVLAAVVAGLPAPQPTVEAANPDVAASEAAVPPATRWGSPVWVVVRASSPREGPGQDSQTHPRQGQGRAQVAPNTRVPSRPVRTEVPADVVTTWVGSAYRFPPETPLEHARFFRLLLEGWIEQLRDPSLYEFSSQINASGQLVVRLSTNREEHARWEARLDDAVSAIARSAEGPQEGPQARMVAALLRRARGIWSRRLANPGDAAIIAADALLRGVAPDQAAAMVQGMPSPPSPDEMAATAGAIRLTSRVVYGN